jgi:serine/threonine protein kinase
MFANEGDLERRIARVESLPIHLQEKIIWIEGLIKPELLLIQNGLIHGDLKLANILLHNGEVMLYDFAATVPINDQLIAPRYPRYSRPINANMLNMTADMAGEIFAIGTCIYTILYGHEPCHEKTEQEVFVLFQSLHFPTISNDSFGRIGSIVSRCWYGDYLTMEALHDDLLSACKELKVVQNVDQGAQGDRMRAREELVAECWEFLAKAKSVEFLP